MLRHHRWPRTPLSLTGILASILLLCPAAHSQIKLPRLISDGMVLQRNIPVKVWGGAAPGESIELEFKGKKYTSIANGEGKWQIQLPPQAAGGPFQLHFSASNKITVQDVLFGDVWLCSGQSNMELAMDRVKDKYPDVIANASNPNIRQFLVPDKYDFEKPQEDVESEQWLSVNAQNILKFSAVAYFFADELYAKYKVPIGLINSALGGAPAEAWISEEAIQKFPNYYSELQRFKSKSLIQQIESSDKTISTSWYSLLNKTDEGLKNGWRKSELDDADWQTMEVPGYWADGKTGIVNGAVWFRKEIEIPKGKLGKPSQIVLGRIVDADSVFINGVFVGTTSYLYPPRKYEFSSSILKEGKNNIAIRVINSSGKGGFVLDKPYALVCGSDSISLRGTWKYKVGTTMNPMPGSTAIRWKPVGLFNSMIAPLLNYPIKGVIWYQGESNTRAPLEYGSLMQTLIMDWRARWHQPDLPFLYVQLANFMETRPEPSESNWAALRQAQLELLSVNNTGMAVAIDLGEWNDVHPLNKLDVGKRLALQAQHIAFGDKKIIASGPLCRSIARKGNKLVLTFSETGNGLIATNDKPLTYFSIAGADKKFVWAKAEIKGNKVIVWSDAISNPITVRYAWADNPMGANLYNKDRLPASPFEATIKE